LKCRTAGSVSGYLWQAAAPRRPAPLGGAGVVLTAEVQRVSWNKTPKPPSAPKVRDVGPPAAKRPENSRPVALDQNALSPAAFPCLRAESGATRLSGMICGLRLADGRRIGRRANSGCQAQGREGCKKKLPHRTSPIELSRARCPASGPLDAPFHAENNGVSQH
jgi:hypothetical protein